MVAQKKDGGAKCRYAFLDTNLLIHFPFVNEIKWPKLLGEKQVCLVLTPVVFDELDDMKDGMTKPGRRDLARRVSNFLISELEKAAPDAEVALPQRPSTKLLYFDKDALDINVSLRTDKQDDRLIAAMLHFAKERPDDDVVLISDDFNLRSRAVRFGFQARNPEEVGIERRELPLTEEERRLRQLERNLPQVEIHFGASDGVFELPYSERRERLEKEKFDSKQRFVDIIATLKSCYEAYAPVYQPPRQLTRYSREQHGIHAAGLHVKEEFDLDVFVEWLSLNRHQTHFMMSEEAMKKDPRYLNYERWKDAITRFFAILEQWTKLRDELAKSLVAYELRVELRHVGGDGLQDAKLVIEVTPPVHLWIKGDSAQAKVHRGCRKRETLIRRESPHTLVYSLGNIHPSQAVALEPAPLLYISDVAEMRKGVRPQISLTLSGLNLKPTSIATIASVEFA